MEQREPMCFKDSPKYFKNKQTTWRGNSKRLVYEPENLAKDMRETPKDYLLLPVKYHLITLLKIS